MELEHGWCAGCGSTAAFERPDCSDHEDECPEMICCACGMAYVGFAISAQDAALVVQPADALPQAA